MKKGLPLFCCLFLLCLQSPADTLAELALKGPLLEMIEESWDVSGGEKNQKREKFERRRFLFHEDGRLLEEYWAGPEGLENTKILYFYDDGGNLVRKTFAQNDTMVPDSSVYLRDQQGLLIELVHTFTVGTYGWIYRYRYDDRGLLTEKEKLELSGEPVSLIRYRYDEKRRVVEESLLDPAGRTLAVQRFIYQADRTIRELYADGDSLTGRRTTVYNQQGDPTAQWSVLSTGKAVLSLSTDYSYDSWGNWTKRVERFTLPDRVILTERLIRYGESPKAQNQGEEE
ncbi:MAG: hypothetical protein JW760_06710 [Spirochaetales bacterium]|nr:hypothetical protein [Spirochaetales bacterium]